MIINIGIDKYKAKSFTKYATNIKPRAFKNVKIKICFASSLPSTFGLFIVRGFKASMSLSINLLKPIAKFLAVNAARIPKNKSLKPNQPFAATTIAIKMKGSEKIECLNITSSLKSFNFLSNLSIKAIVSKND